jgi:hypothetical protein
MTMTPKAEATKEKNRLNLLNLKKIIHQRKLSKE